ncbi:MAG TPA: sigma factor-like helix-turn-helix DNA-binding protein [Acidimicrobiia bacterium]|nr:sigma factor-like helix-turn-helix DNA-binding protein [Acidimicrobiia bacterium]
MQASPVRIDGRIAGAPAGDAGIVLESDNPRVLTDLSDPPSGPPPSAALGPDGGEAFSEFYRAAYADVARALSYTLGDVELGREATDEAMARAYASWDKIRDFDSPAGWTYRVGLNWAYSTRRRLVRALPFVARSHAAEPPISDPAVATALGNLDFKLRAVVVCRLLLDWSVEETAEALRIKPGTVKSRLHRALAILERSLGHMRS